MSDADRLQRISVAGAPPMIDDDDGGEESANRLPAFFARESFTDCAGVDRMFELTVHERGANEFAAYAHEVTTDEFGGYIFKAFAQTSLSLALGRLRGKIRAGIAQRFLIPGGKYLAMPSDRMRGRIAPEGVVVDGQLLDWASLEELMVMHEGWEFELRIPLEPDW